MIIITVIISVIIIVFVLITMIIIIFSTTILISIFLSGSIIRCSLIGHENSCGRKGCGIRDLKLDDLLDLKLPRAQAFWFRV